MKGRRPQRPVSAKERAAAAATMSGASRAMFRKMDTDKDGHLSRAELDAGHAALKKQRR